MRHIPPGVPAMRSSLCCLFAMLAAGCASTPDDSLAWSDQLASTLEREGGEVVEVARFSSLRPGAAPAPWEPWLIVRGNALTSYRVAEVDGVVALAAEGGEGGSGMSRNMRIDPQHHPLL